MNKISEGKKSIFYIKSLLLVGVLVGFIVLFRNQLFLNESVLISAPDNNIDPSFGWKFPVSEFQPMTGRVRNMGAFSALRTKGIPRGLPERLIIPKIGVNTAIEDAQITSDGRMDVPKGSINVAWFSLGPQPGQIGSAVIGGHFGIKDGIPFVFYNLDKLVPGDSIYIVDDYGNNIGFIVRSIELFDRNGDATSVFVSNDGLAHLNLITCEGEWNKVNGTYPERRVVFADLVAPAANVSAVTSNANNVSKLPLFGDNGTPISIKEFFRRMYESPEDALIVSAIFVFIIFVAFRLSKVKKVGQVKRQK